MDEFYEYWELIPEFAKYEEVGKEIVKYKRNLPDPDLTARDLPTNVIEFFKSHLVSHPYPTWEILYHIIDIRNQEKNRVLEELVVSALIDLIDVIVKHPNQRDKRDKLYNLLSNIYVSEWCMNRVRDVVVPRLYELKENLGLLDEVLLLALLSRSVLTLLTQYMNYERQQNKTKCLTKSLFLRTCYEKVHWVTALLDDENDGTISSLDHKVCQHLRFFRLILKMESVRLNDYAWWMELELIDASVFEPGSALQLCHLELTRQKHIFQFLNAHHHVGSFDQKMLVTNNILSHLLSLHVDFSLRDFFAIKKLLQTNHALNRGQLEASKSEPFDKRRTEVELFHEFMVVKLYLNIVQTSDASQDFIDEHLQHIRNLLQTINDGNVLFQLMQSVFTLLFLRFEHVRKTKRKRKNNGTADTQLNGFVCLKTNLKAVLNSMRLFLMRLDQLDVHRTFSEDLKKKFVSLLKNVDNALWRLSIIDGDSSQKKAKSSQTVKEWLRFKGDNRVNYAAIPHAEITSEDETIAPKKKVNRKKLKKRLKVSVKTDENDEASDDPIEFQLVTETSLTENSESRTQSRSTESQKRVRSIMSKLLMSPESLVTICMLKGDSSNVQRVIHEYNLERSDVASEVNFINNFKNTKDKLREIVACFKKITQRPADAMSKSIEMDEIRNVAEGGFEKAKLLNVVDKFTSSNKLMVRECDVQLIKKATVQHPNLRMYQEDLLNVLPLVDFMISLPCSYELNTCIYKYIMMQWNLPDVVDDTHFGYRKFLKNLMDVLTILKNNNIDKSVGELFNDNVFTMEPSVMKKQFENRQNLIEMMNMDVNVLNGEAELTEILHKFDLFECGDNFLAKIVCYIRNVKLLMKFHTNESFSVDNLMMMDLDDVIGKIIFHQQNSPEQVENFAYNVNVNLIHSMALAATGEFLSPSGAGDEKLLTLFHMNETGASSIDLELDGGVKENNYAINNMDVLYYIKKEGSFMVAYLMKEIQSVDYKTLMYDDPNFVQRLMELKSVESSMDLFNNNKLVTALNFDHINLKLLLKKIKDTEDLEVKLQILANISERQWNRNKAQFNELRDSYIEMLITTQPDKLERLEEIESVGKFSELLLRCVGDIKSDDVAERWLRWCLDSRNADKLDETTLVELQNWMKKLKIYRKVVKMFKAGGSDVTWAKIKSLSDEQPAIIVNYLLNINMNLVLCMDFMKIHPLKPRSDEITKMWVEALNNKKVNDQHHLMFKIINTFPSKKIIEFFDFSLEFIKNLPAMVRIMNFVNGNIDNVPAMTQIRYQKFTISTKIFECLDDDREELWSLASRPLVILEQFLMNSKVETLRNVIKEVRCILDNESTCSACATTSSSMYQVGENLIYDFDAFHDDLMITNECIDLLLKLYAAKALDFQIVEVHSIPASSSEVSSIDSSFGIFQMPKEIPPKEQWIPDGDTSHCMCCKRQKFSLLTRRHHCRRCGRVVCQPCSQNRVQLDSYYNELKVRVCLDCYQQLDVERKRSEDGFVDKGRCADETIEWKLTGNISSDQLVRDEFNFEYSPNVGLCIAIIDLHTSNDELAKFLLFHCHRLELLLRPIRGKLNPEVDLILVAKMLKCLAFSAKVRGADGEADTIIDHADVVLKVSENGCESIAPQIPMEAINQVTIRAAINDLIKAENWKMALELSVKWDRSGTAGVFSAWGVSAIKCGQYRFARDKIALALQPVSGSSPKANEEFVNMLNGSDDVDVTQFSFKRVSRSPPLLHEVLETLETTASKLTISGPLQSPFNSKLSPGKESAKNVLNVMDSLRKIVEGDYGSSIRKPSDKFKWHSSLLLNSPYYDESMFYLINYGGNDEFLTFLIRNNLVPLALRYVLAQQVSHELFIQHVFTPIVKVGKLSDLMELIKRMDPSLLTWKDYIMSTCKFLERRRAFNCLYHLQMLTGDLVRAAMTCIKFYLDGSGNYTELHAKAHHITNAKNHLQTELEKTEWNKAEKQESGRKDGITLKWDLKTINAHINIITLQLQMAKYLAKCEADGLPTIGLMPKIFMDKPGMKTMFGKSLEKSQVAILLLICGHSIESGFGISYRVIHECSLKSTKIYTTCTKYLAKNLPRLLEVEKLVNTIKANAANEENIVDPETLRVCDELIAMAVEIAYNQHQTEAKAQIDQLIKLISSRDMKIQCYINSNQLKTAYMLCAATNNLDDIRRIMKQAENTRQENVRRLCEKKLLQRSGEEKTSQESKSDINQL